MLRWGRRHDTPSNCGWDGIMRTLGRGNIIFFHHKSPNEMTIMSSHLRREYLNKDSHSRINDCRICGHDAFNFE
jgi:hypothetical protein